jgi:hypothetical protein
MATRIPSPAQIEASRRNGRLARGPVTPRGLSASAQNAARHGLRARCPVLPGESPREYRRIVADTIDHFQPRDGYERLLCVQIADAYFRCTRATAIETGLLSAEAQKAAKAEPGLRNRVYQWQAFDQLCHQTNNPLPTLFRYLTTFDNRFHKAVLQLERHRRIQDQRERWIVERTRASAPDCTNEPEKLLKTHDEPLKKVAP